ncbi:MAG: glycosyltransferase family 2 protein [Clostridia bacterium]|nr:glycosyltransferase family 2 protein [Clostridia bacterium]
MPTISVVMGIYNCAKTLEEAVNCIINQTYTDWELIMCDDCSTDETYAVAESLAQRDERIVLLKNEKNLTLAPTLNKCISYAKGRYIARMDGDDLCKADRFEKELAILENNPQIAVVGCNMDLFDENGVYRTIYYNENPTLVNLVKTSQFCHASCIMRAEVIKELNGYDVSDKCKRVEDYDLWVRLYAAGYKGYNIQESLYLMRDDRNSKKRRSLKNRVNECGVMKRAFKLAKMPFYKYPFVYVPIIKFFTPNFIYKIAHKKKKKNLKEG